MRPQLRHGAHGGSEILLADGRSGFLSGDVDGFRQRLLLRLLVELGIGRAGIFALVLLLLDAEDVGRALVAGEQVLAVVGVEEFSQRLDAADDQQQIVLAFEREHRIDEIVPRALLAQLDFQAIGKKNRRSPSFVPHRRA